MSFEKEFDDIISGRVYDEDDFSYRGEEEFTPKPPPQEDNENKDETPKGKRRGKPNKLSKEKPKPKAKNKTSTKSSSNNKSLRIKVVLISLLLSGLGLFAKFVVFKDTTNTELASNTPANNKNEELPTLQNELEPPEEEEPKTNQEPTVTMDDDINPGLPDIEGGHNDTTTGTTVDPNEFVKDINGNELPKRYEVDKISYEVDFVSYTKKRGVTADGVELLWLDAEYKGNPYTIQVPFKVWKELDQEGITVVNMEVLTVNKDYKVISYMEVKDNYKEIMEKGEKELRK